jgi:hypothetical protein
MGQYYRGAILGKKSIEKEKITIEKALCCYVHDNGAKLMEHSYVGNTYVGAYVKLLAKKYYGYPFVWVGDYADDKFNVNVHDKALLYIKDVIESNAKKQGYVRENDSSFNKFIRYDSGDILILSTMKNEDDFAEKYSYEEVGGNQLDYKYILNLDKKQYVKIPEYNENEWTIHPLPLLCADGNGRGGGDYSGSDMDKVGVWAYDKIGISNEIPNGFTELVVNFEEQ